MNARISTHLNGRAFAKALISGIHRVIDEQDFLNRINVFPVADGDTGTNLSLSLGSALPVLRGDGDLHLGTLLARVADALLDGSRGNSGAIVAQFFQGMSDAAGELNRFTPYTFSVAVSQGSDYAHDALENPREGTILSVISAFARSLRRYATETGGEHFDELMTLASERISEALAETPKQLDVLRKANVVDAGAKGFVTLVSGMAEFILHGRIAPEPDLSALFSEDMSFEGSAEGDESAYRYCTECIITGDDIDRRKLREALSSLGDSLVLAGTKRKAKIHIHVDDPDDVFTVARSYGKLSAEKADDMHRQHVSSHNENRRFAVITDSAADIPDEDMERFDIHMVPARIQFGERGYLDKVSITTEEFYHELETNPNHPTTSQPAPGDFRRQFQFLASHFADVISVNVTARVSGTYQAARASAERVNAPGHIRIIDSRNASVGEGMLAVKAAEFAQRGMRAEEAAQAIEALIPKTLTFALVKDMRYAVRGGRVPRWVRTAADLLRVTPVLHTVPDGRVATGTFLLGRSNRVAKFAKHVARRIPYDGPYHVGIGHAICRDQADDLAERMRKLLPGIERLTITRLGTAIGVHGGPGTLIVAVQPAR